MDYLNRNLIGELEKWLGRKEIIAIKGPRQAGKTTTLKILKEHLIVEKKVSADRVIYITFEDRDILEAFDKSPKEYINSYVASAPDEKFYFLIDEFQYLKEGGQKLKLLYDIYENAKFIITGSSSLEISEHTAKYLVGRVFSFNLYQFSFFEYLQTVPKNLRNAYLDASKVIENFLIGNKPIGAKEDIFEKDFSRYFEDFVTFGGYPEVIKAGDAQTKKIILKNIYDTYITKDIVGLLRIRDISGFRAVVSLLANQAGNLLNLQTLASDSGSYFRQLKQYISILEETYIINNLRPYFRNKTTELKKNPKVYFVDTGLRNYIVNNFNEFRIRPDSGNLVENAVLSGLRDKKDDGIKYWRTMGQAEVDFIIGQPDNIIPVEVKYSSMKRPEITRSLKTFISAYKPKKVLVLTKGFWGKAKFETSEIGFAPVWYI